MCSFINDCINIENNINDINIIDQNINKFKVNNQIKINFSPDEDTFKKYLETLNSFGKIYYNCYFQFKECPKNINNKRVYSISGENNNIITKTGPDGWMGTICENELDKSIEEHKWKIKLLNVQYKDVMVGVAPIDFDINSSSSTCGWYLYYHNSCLYSGPQFNYSGKNTNLSKVNDDIIVVMNMKKRTLKYIINNEDKGDSFINIPIDKPLFPSVLLYHQNDSIEISECE